MRSSKWQTIATEGKKEGLDDDGESPDRSKHWLDSVHNQP